MSPYQNLIVKDLLLSDQLDMRWELVEQNVYKRPFKCYKIQMAPSLDIQHVMKFSKKSHAIHQQHILSAACLCDMVLLFFLLLDFADGTACTDSIPLSHFESSPWSVEENHTDKMKSLRNMEIFTRSHRFPVTGRGERS